MRRFHLFAATAILVLSPGFAHAAIQTFFNASQTVASGTPGATSDTVLSEGYKFTCTLDKWWYATISLGPGQPTGRLTPITWPTGLDAQTITAGPSGTLASQGPATVTIQRLDGSAFDLLSFTGQILGNTAGAGAAFELMPTLNGNDGFANPLTYDATGIAGNAFSYSPNLTGFDTYNLSLWMDYGLTALTVNGNPVPEPASLAVVGIGSILMLMRRHRASVR